MNVHVVVRLAAAFGGVAMCLGGLARVLAAIGASPPFVFQRLGSLSIGERFGDFQVEFLVAAWFLAVAGAYGRSAPDQAGSTALAVFSSSAIASGFLGWLIVTRSDVWPIVVGGACSLVVLIGAAVTKWPGHLWSISLAGVRELWRSPRRRAAWALYAAIVTLVLCGVHVAASSVPPRAARARDIARWYGHMRTRVDTVTESELGVSRGVRIVAFTSYPWQPFRNTLADRIRQADAFKKLGLPVDFVVKNFPLDPKCNTALRPPLIVGQSGCEAAYTVAFVEKHYGRSEAGRLGEWLYRRGTVLEPELIRHELDRSGRGEAFLQTYETWREAVQLDIRLAARLGVTNVPSYFINGVGIPGSTEAFDAILRAELSRHRTSETAQR